MVFNKRNVQPRRAAEPGARTRAAEGTGEGGVSADSQVSGEALPTSIGQCFPLRWVCSEEYLVRQNS